jgi:hypothetical protein
MAANSKSVQARSANRETKEENAKERERQRQGQKIKMN